MRLFGLAILTCLLAPASLPAQDAHYWTFQYGPRSSLLGGAVIGSVADVSATFYNPGALPLAPSLAFAVSANVLEIAGIALKDGGGEGVDIGTKRSGLRPSLIAGTIGRNLLGNDVLAYSAITRTKGTQDLQGFALLSGTAIQPSLSLDEFAGLVLFDGEYSDTWLGLSYARGLSSNFGVGLTWYGAFRSQRRRAQSLSQSIATDRSGNSFLDLRGGRYSTIRTLAKIGTYFASGPFTAGLTFTTPSLHISGSGQLGFNTARFGADTTSLAANVQTDLPAEYKSPMSVGGGGAFEFRKTRVHVSAEWFDAIDPYFVMQGEDFVSQEPPETFTVDAVQEVDEVFNWGIGVERVFSPRFGIYASYSVDKSGFTEDVVRAGLSILPIDINTVTAGTEFAVGPARFTLGAGYGWGSKVDRELTDLIRQTDPDFVATYVYRSMRFIFGFEIGGG